MVVIACKRKIWRMFSLAEQIWLVCLGFVGWFGFFGFLGFFVCVFGGLGFFFFCFGRVFVVFSFLVLGVCLHVLGGFFWAWWRGLVLDFFNHENLSSLITSKLF